MKSLNINNYDLFIFDWDGVLVDSLGADRELDRLFIKEFYGVEKSLEEVYKMSNRIKTGAVNGSENDYPKYLDIWDNIYR